nr:E3 ubiquitin-protein ligase TRIM39-like [Misgurnus anguillicaudatus]XP_055075349.1 E3 ubiquitin-protein ligase TRIM39-like [Misgurnus anguillicaudatus]XP_055075350.1 E3 ubiquitin-protein ligase TRIM39-like [Misgurnus anguillicaudatus]
MSSSTNQMTEELQCSICLDVFNDPVSTPCGHNFCEICLKKHWDNSQDCSCPNCRETFTKRPELKINTTLRDLVDEHKKKTEQKQPEVLCDICEEVKLKSVKSCLVCQSSYCQTHLDRHLRVTGLQKHKLIDPVNNLQDYICQKHERPLELFCRDDQTCVCLICTVTDHKNHNTVTVKEEREKKKIELLKTQTDVQQMIQDKIKNIQDIKHSAELKRLELLKMEEKQTLEEKEDEDLIKDLEQEITELKRRNSELEKITNTEENLHLIQVKHLKGWRRQQHFSSAHHLKHLRLQSSRLVGRIRSHLWFLVVPVGISLLMLYLTSSTDFQTLNIEKLNELVFKKIQQYAVDVTLDPDTASPYLILSDDKKQVRDGNMWHELPDNPKRFTMYHIVLGNEGFSSGRFYFEVQVKGKTGWVIGVASESVNRKESITMKPVNGFWSVTLRNGNQYNANADFSVSLSLKVSPQKVGVFVDYEEGLVSFYDVESRSHIYSFTDQSFNEKLYPYFNPGSNIWGRI